MKEVFGSNPKTEKVNPGKTDPFKNARKAGKIAESCSHQEPGKSQERNGQGFLQ